jgi:hypothetical protein
MATPGDATGPEMAGELFKVMTGLDMVTVRYHGDARTARAGYVSTLATQETIGRAATPAAGRRKRRRRRVMVMLRELEHPPS